MNSTIFLVENPQWTDTPDIVEAFQDMAERIGKVAGDLPISQDSSLAFHVIPGSQNFGQITKKCVREDVVGEGEFFGLTRHQANSSMTIDKSMKYRDGAFVKVQRVFSGHIKFSQIALALLEDEAEALKIIGIDEIPA
ncbi:MAG: hypothetical protein ABIZ80_03365 [Bryobacteraceae bacterium]